MSADEQTPSKITFACNEVVVRCTLEESYALGEQMLLVTSKLGIQKPSRIRALAEAILENLDAANSPGSAPIRDRLILFPQFRLSPDTPYSLNGKIELKYRDTDGVWKTVTITAQEAFLREGSEISPEEAKNSQKLYAL